MRRRMRRGLQLFKLIALLLSLAGIGACAHTEYFPGTTILRNEDNTKIIETVEQ